MSQTRQLRFVRRIKQPTTIIIPVYNAEKYLRECLDSLLAQSSREWDAILVDDGSTDSSGAICDEYATRDARFKVIHQPNGGQSNARNTGLENATGLYVVFIDADDILHPLFIEQMAKMLKDTGTDIAQCTFLNATKCKWPKSTLWDAEMFETEDAIASILYQEHLSSSTCAKMFKRNLFDDVRFHDGLYYEDLELIVRLIDQTKARVVFTHACLYFYRVNHESFIHTLTEKRFDVRKVVNMIESLFADRSTLLKAAQDRKFAANCNIFLLTWRIPMYASISHDCLKVMRAYRWKILTNPRSRFKNKFGAILSYFLFNRFISGDNTHLQSQPSCHRAIPTPNRSTAQEQA